MAWTLASNLGFAPNPYKLYGYTSADVQSWSNQDATIPSDTNGIKLRYLLRVTLRATTVAATLQFSITNRLMTYVELRREGQLISPPIPVPIMLTGAPGLDTEVLPIATWIVPFDYPLRPGDSLRLFVPGDAGVATMDWELYLLFGPEI